MLVRETSSLKEDDRTGGLLRQYLGHITRVVFHFTLFLLYVRESVHYLVTIWVLSYTRLRDCIFPSLLYDHHLFLVYDFDTGVCVKVLNLATIEVSHYAFVLTKIVSRCTGVPRGAHFAIHN